MKKVWLGMVLALLADAASADTAALQRCRTMADAAQRLACYDAIALPVAETAAPAAPGSAASAADANADFGLARRDAGSERLESRIVGQVHELTRGTRFVLENGQVWQVTEGSTGYYYADNPKATVKRGVLSGYFIVIEGVNATPRVRRVQ